MSDVGCSTRPSGAGGDTSCKQSSQWERSCSMALCIAWSNVSPVVHENTAPKWPKWFQKCLYVPAPNST